MVYAKAMKTPTKIPWKVWENARPVGPLHLETIGKGGVIYNLEFFSHPQLSNPRARIITTSKRPLVCDCNNFFFGYEHSEEYVKIECLNCEAVWTFKFSLLS